MSDRLRVMQRIVAVQAQRKRLAEWTLATIAGRQAALAEAQASLGGFIEGENLTGPLAVLALTQTRRLAERGMAAAADHARQQAVLQAAERRHRLAERIAEAAAAEQRQVIERRDLERLIETTLRPKPDDETAF